MPDYLADPMAKPGPDWVDPIVEEVRSVRQRLAAECDHDLDKWFEKMHELQAKDTEHEIVSYPPRRPATELGDAAPDTRTPPPSTN